VEGHVRVVAGAGFHAVLESVHVGAQEVLADEVSVALKGEFLAGGFGDVGGWGLGGAGGCW
jgi:hypothetical protein